MTEESTAAPNEETTAVAPGTKLNSMQYKKTQYFLVMITVAYFAFSKIKIGIMQAWARLYF